MPDGDAGAAGLVDVFVVGQHQQELSVLYKSVDTDLPARHEAFHHHVVGTGGGGGVVPGGGELVELPDLRDAAAARLVHDLEHHGQAERFGGGARLIRGADDAEGSGRDAAAEEGLLHQRLIGQQPRGLLPDAGQAQPAADIADGAHRHVGAGGGDGADPLLTRDAEEITTLTAVRIFLANAGCLAAMAGVPLLVAVLGGGPLGERALPDGLSGPLGERALPWRMALFMGCGMLPSFVFMEGASGRRGCSTSLGPSPSSAWRRSTC